MRKFIQLFFLVTLLVAISVFGPARLAIADTPGAAAAFKRGDYPQALTLFRMLVAAGHGEEDGFAVLNLIPERGNDGH